MTSNLSCPEEETGEGYGAKGIYGLRQDIKFWKRIVKRLENPWGACL